MAPKFGGTAPWRSFKWWLSPVAALVAFWSYQWQCASHAQSGFLSESIAKTNTQPTRTAQFQPITWSSTRTSLRSNPLPLHLSMATITTRSNRSQLPPATALPTRCTVLESRNGRIWFKSESQPPRRAPRNTKTSWMICLRTGISGTHLRWCLPTHTVLPIREIWFRNGCLILLLCSACRTYSRWNQRITMHWLIFFLVSSELEWFLLFVFSSNFVILF